MTDEIIEIGARLKIVRERIKSEGIALTASGLASILHVSRDSIANYETGRAIMPVEVLLKLYRLGINPLFMLTGIGTFYADNNAGNNLSKNQGECDLPIRLDAISRGDASSKKVKVMKVAAGIIESIDKTEK